MKQKRAGRRMSIKRNVGKLQRACDGAVRFDGLEERRLMTTVFTVTNNADAGAGSLREAITCANSTPGADSIHFAITGDTKIELASELPALTDAVSIDGTTQTAYAGTPLVWIDGSAGIDSGGTPTFAGLKVQGGNTTIRGLALTSFAGAISLSGGAGDSVTGCYIGFDPTANAPDSSYANYGYGIEVANSGSTIGGTAAGDANVISLNNDDGILVDGGGTTTTIIGNRIGSDATGTLPEGNGNNGIRISGASGVTIGGLAAGEANLIVGNFGNGIEIDGGTGVRVVGNSIGQNPAATDAFLSNFGDGIAIFDVASAAGATPQVLVDSNLVSSNFGDGIRLTDSGGVTITGNVVGSAAAPDVGVDFGNNGDGIGLEGTSSGNRIGGVTAGEGNTIAYNLGAGVAVYVADDPAASGVGNAIRGNSIHDNSSVGIDLTETPGLRGFEVFSGLGPTPNDSAQTGHVGPNAYQDFPVIASAGRNTATGAVTIHGSLSAVPDTDYSIDLFGNQAANSSGYGEGEHYLASVTVHTNHAGHVTFVQTVPGVDPAYGIFSATATDPNGNTSEFSAVSEAVSVGSTTTLATSLNPSVYGTAVTFTATVTGSGVGAPGGVVTFMDGGSVLGTGMLDASGVATFTTSTLSAAHHPIEAVYEGDEQYSGSKSAALVQAVTPAPLTVTVKDATKVYGAANPAFSATYSGFVNGEAPGALSGTLGFTTSGVHAGTYAVHASGQSATNYAISYVDGNLSITKAGLTITADSKSKTYGAAVPTLTASYSGLVNGDTPASLTTPVALSTMATAGSDVGLYAITAAGAASDDYDITFADGTLAVGKASLTITAGSGSKVYGDANPALGATYVGFVNGDGPGSLTTLPTVSSTVDVLTHVGSYPVTAGGAVSGNYSFAYGTGWLTVTPAALTVKVANASKIYGQANPAFALAYFGFKAGDNPGSLSGAPAFVTGAGATSHAGVYTVSVGALSSPDYTITFQDGTLTVNKAQLTITADNKTKTYGAALPSLTASYSGLVNGDTAASLSSPVTLDTSATAGSDVGSYPIVALGAASDDYDITFVNGTLAIAKASLQITANNASKVYGAANPALAASYGGFVNGDTPTSLATLPTLSTGADTLSHVGSYPITAGGAVSGNYTISYVAGSLTVTPAALTVKVADSSKVYGQADPAFTLEYAGFVNSDGAGSLDGSPLTLSDAESTAHVGAYAVSVGGLSSPDYSITFQNGTLTVNKAALTVTVNNASRAFGLANPAFSVGYDGFVNGDSAASLGGAVAFATAATAGSTVGNYSVTASGLTAADYNITYAPGTLAIVRAATTTGLSSSASSVGAGQPVTFTATVAGNPGFVPSGSVTFFDNGVSLGTVALSGGVATLTTGGLTAGNHAITAAYGGSADYLASNGGPITQGVTAGLTISGTVYRDATGNGLSDDDAGLAGVTVNLYADSDHNGALSAADQVVAHTLSGANGAYAFTAQPGVYFLGELTPAGYVQTGPATPLYYTLNASSGGTSVGNDFDNFLADCDVHDVSSVSYLINGTTVVDQLRGSVHQGDTVEVIFTVPAGAPPHQFSFVSYTAPGSTFDADNAHQQMVYDSDTGVFGPGVHTLTVTVPDAYFQVDFVCGAIIDHLGPAGSNIFYTPQGRLIGADNGGTQAPINAPSSISGFVYLDANNNGSIDLVDGAIAGVKVTLTGTDDKGKAVSMVEFTDSDGRYFFGGLRPGTYSIAETQPTGVSDGRDTLGSIAGSAASTFGAVTANDRFAGIKLAASRDGINYNFGELGCAVQRGQTASIGFWQNSNGQALLKGLNNGSTDTNLGIWLAGNFPNMYGQNAGAASLLGKTNAQIAAFYSTLYKTAAQKLDAQVLALAFATYVTDAQLAGTVARNYGFTVSDVGLGSATYNVGANGAAFGVANNATVAVSQLLQVADDKSWNGTLWDADRSGTLSATETGWRNLAYTVFNAINNAGGL